MKKFNVVKNRAIFFILTAVVIVLGAACMIFKGFNFDIDFVGGSELNIDVGASVDKAALDDIEAKVIEIIGQDNFSSIRTAGSNNEQIIVRTKVLDSEMDNVQQDLTEAESAQAAEVAETAETEETPEIAETAETEEQVTTGSQMREAVFEAIKEIYPEAELVSADNVSAEVSEDLKRSAVMSATIAVILMLIYIAFRFQVSSAFASVLCLVHDLFIMLAAYSLLGIPVNANIIAALLTILGYSINATIIIFDRVRENDKILGRTADFAEKVDISIKQSLTRSINTTITTLLTIGMIYILGVTSIKQFALPLIIGILAGFYSSVCLSGSLWYVFKKHK